MSRLMIRWPWRRAPALAAASLAQPLVASALEAPVTATSPPARPATALIPEPELRWIEGTVGCTDLVDADGHVRGYVGSTARCVRGYVVQSGSEWPPRPAAFADHPTAEAARKWVEAQVTKRRMR